MPPSSKDFPTYPLETLRLREDGETIDVTVYDMCADSDCRSCCTERLNDYASKLRAVRPQQISAVAKRRLAPETESLVIAGPAGPFAATLRERYPQLEQLSLADLAPWAGCHRFWAEIALRARSVTRLAGDVPQTPG